jgi:TPR repeat protein
MLDKTALAGRPRARSALSNNLFLLPGVDLRTSRWPRSSAGLCATAHWFRKAADQGSAAAQWLLGVMYYLGGGVYAPTTWRPPDGIEGLLSRETPGPKTILG